MLSTANKLALVVLLIAILGIAFETQLAATFHRIDHFFQHEMDRLN